MLGKRLLTSVAAGILIAASGTAGAAANFDADVAASIDKGLAWFDAGWLLRRSPFSCGDATGLALLALLEKRPSADADSAGLRGRQRPPTKRACAAPCATSSIRSTARPRGSPYRDGAYMMALSVYMRVGRPGQG